MFFVIDTLVIQLEKYPFRKYWKPKGEKIKCLFLWLKNNKSENTVNMYANY